MKLIKIIIYNLTPYYLIKKYNSLRNKLYKLKTYKYVKALIANKDIVNLELGSGPKKGGNNWVTIDICEGCDIKYNFTTEIPFPSDSVDMIYASHVLEHFFYKDLINLLHECHRILKKGGRFSIAIPNATIYINKYLNPDKIELQYLYEPALSINSPIDYINYIAYMDTNHRYLFDDKNMIIILEKIGFRDITQRNYDPKLDTDFRDWESLYFESNK